MIDDVGPGWLFVPGDRPERYEKAIAASDLAIIDLEDAVRSEAKDKARGLLQDSGIAPERICVRVNSFGTEHVEKDLEVVRSLGIPRVMIPMAEADQPFDSLAGLEVVALIETARGVIESARIAAEPMVVGLALGSVDLEVDLRMRRAINETNAGTVPSDPIHYARMRLLYSARAYGRAVIDSARPSVDDICALRREADSAKTHGFDGKLAIHPRQVEAIREGFAPSLEEVEWARNVLAESRARKEGAFVLDGELIDAVVVRRAEYLTRNSD